MHYECFHEFSCINKIVLKLISQYANYYYIYIVNAPPYIQYIVKIKEKKTLMVSSNLHINFNIYANYFYC